MSKRKHITLKIILFLAFIDVIETIGQFCFKKSVASAGLMEIHSLADGIGFIQSVIPSPFLWLGLFCVLFIFISWSTALSRIDLSAAVAICSFSYITIPIASVIFLHEKVSTLRWSGICLVLVGVILVSLSSKHKEIPV
jgi:drug/metabolite transporter (DMT)-like permease